MKVLLICTCLFILALPGTVRGQLLTPTMVCEMQCLQKLGAPQSLTYSDPRAQNCRQYCLKHAYDSLLGLTTPPKE